MAKFTIYWDAGWGQSTDTVEAENEAAAIHMAWEAWRDDAESQAIYGIVPEGEEEDFV